MLNDFRLSIELNTDTKQTKISRSCNNTLRDFILNHHHEQAWWISAFQKMTECWRRNIIWQICYKLIRIRSKNLTRINIEQVAFHDFDICIIRRCFSEQRQHFALQLNSHNTSCMLRKFSCQNSSTCPQLQHLVIGINFCCFDDVQ